MKGITDYRKDMLVLLGDETGRRFSDSILDMGLREALVQYQEYFPRMEQVTFRVSGAAGQKAVVPWMFPPSVVPRWVRRKSTEEVLRCGIEVRAGKLLLSLYEDVDDVLVMDVPVPHTIKGLDDGKETTVPDGHALTLCGGAAGYAMRIRARSVTEVFGKRPEDREALSSQANRLIGDFENDLKKISLTASFQQNPWPVSNFRI